MTNAFLISASVSASLSFRGSRRRTIPPRNRIDPSMIAGMANRYISKDEKFESD
jgi:hypothetical protein